jgi:4-amino-4-deoxy-L-arabinose transferase-like glycosyltransferase
MSTIARETEASGVGRPTASQESGDRRARTRRRVSILVAVVVLAWSIVELGSLVSRHTIGPEMYGVLVAGLSVVAGALTLTQLASSHMRLWATVGVLILWAVVALGGLAGTVAHVVGPVAGHGPIDLRPRPIPAPLVFTLLGLVGGAALWFGRRHESRGASEDREE